MLMKLNFKIVCILLLASSGISVYAQKPLDENYLAGIAMYERGIPDSALIYLQKSLQEHPQNTNANFYLGTIYFEMNYIEEAIKHFQIVEKKQVARASLMLVKAYTKAGDAEKAIEYLDIHLKSNYKEAESKILLDPVIQGLETNALWIDFWKNNNAYSGFDEAIASIKYLMKSEDYLEAINLASESLEKSYRKSPLLALRAEIYNKLGNYSLAINDLNDAISGDKRNSDLFIARAKILIKQEKYKLALEDLNFALKSNPENFDIYPVRAFASQKMGLIELAKSDMNFYLKYFPDDDEAWFNFGEIFKAEGLYFDALRCYNKCIVMDNTKSEYYLSRGETYFKTRTYKYANNDLSMALDLDPRNAKAHYIKGKANLSLGDKELACYCFKQAYELGLKESYNEMIKYCPIEK